ncbi:hypothetical protein HDU84_008950, partial [Entophlyctis sp. JEL0112]
MSAVGNSSAYLFSDRSRSTPVSPPIGNQDVIYDSSSSFVAQPIKSLPAIPRNVNEVQDQEATKLRAKIRQLQTELEKLDNKHLQTQSLISKISDANKSVTCAVNDLSIIQSILAFCLDKGLSRTAEVLQFEAPAVVSTSMQNFSKRKILKDFIDSHSFDKALYMI